MHRISPTYQGPREARRICGLCFLCTSPVCGQQKVKWGWYWPRHKPPPGRRRTARSCCSGCHISPPAPWELHHIIKVANRNFLNTKKTKNKAYRPAWMPSHVEESLISTLSLLTPASSYREMSRRARDTMLSLSNDNLGEKGSLNPNVFNTSGERIRIRRDNTWHPPRWRLDLGSSWGSPLQSWRTAYPLCWWSAPLQYYKYNHLLGNYTSNRSKYE